MNFKMKIAVFAGEQCIGGLSPIVFRDLQGTYSVTSYGEDIPCETVREMLGSNEEEDEWETDVEDPLIPFINIFCSPSEVKFILYCKNKIFEKVVVFFPTVSFPTNEHVYLWKDDVWNQPSIPNKNVLA